MICSKAFFNSILLITLVITGCSHVDEKDISAKKDKKRASIISSSCDSRCRNYVSKKLNLKKIWRKSRYSVAGTKLSSIDGIQDRYALEWHKEYKVFVSPGKHKLVTRAAYIDSAADEKVFSFESTEGQTYFVGDAILEKGLNKQGHMLYSWTPVVFDNSNQTIIYPTDNNKWKEKTEIGIRRF